MKIAILGFDVEGKASFDYFARGGHEIHIRDQNSDLEVPEEALSILGVDYLNDLGQYDLLVRTPGLHPSKILEKNPDVQTKITTHVSEFLKASPTRNIIGVTGTKGKGTTSSLITGMLQAAGKDAYLGGNIGLPPFTFMNKLTADSYVVLELSSFQLIDLKSSPHIAVTLMVEPEHLNWHEDFEEYIAAKQQLFIHQEEDDIAIYNARNENSVSVADASLGQQIPYMESPGAYVHDDQIMIDDQVVCATSELKLFGQHNWQNVCAAVTAVWQVSQDLEAIRAVLKTFAGLPHRLEFVREVSGIKYYDDSFGTTPETAIVAVQAFQEPKVVILGGSDKGATYDELAKAVKTSKVRAAIVIGDTGPAIALALKRQGFDAIIDGGDTMQAIVGTARKQAQPGDIILLSTGCASFGLFENYKDRGEQFSRVVRALA